MPKFMSMFIAAIFLNACASADKDAAVSTAITFPAKVTLTEADGTQREVPAGTAVHLRSEFAYVKSPGYASLLIILKPGTEKLSHLELQPLSDWGPSDYLPAMDRTLAQVMSEIYKIQVDLGAKNSTAALTKIRELRSTHKNLIYLKLLEISALLIDNKRAEALTILNELKVQLPDSDEVKKMQFAIEKGA